jgi:hypothetical protein
MKSGLYYVNRRFTIYILHQILMKMLESRRVKCAGHILRSYLSDEKYTERFPFQTGRAETLLRREGNADVDLKKQDVSVWADFEWLTIGSSGELL